MKHNISRWALDHADELGLKVKESTWISEWIPGYHSLHCIFEMDTQRVSGHGIAESQELALIKAIAEAVERYFCIENKIHTNGVAAYPTLDGVKKRAFSELKERDAFLCHYLTQKPFVSEISLKKFEKAQSKLADTGVRIKALQMCTQEGDIGILCLAMPVGDNHRFSSLIGLAYGTDVQEVVRKAYFECLESVVIYLNRRSSVESVESLNSPRDHKNLFLTDKYKNFILEFSNRVGTESYSPPILDVQFVELKSANPLFDSVPLKVVRAVSKDCQPMFYGETKIEKLNLKRLESFLGAPMNPLELNYMPHCIG